jgi:RNA polymerase sigma-70 factor (ECF subfamily)
MDNKTDKDLMKLIVKKNSTALKVLYRRYEKQIFNFIYKYTGSRGVAQELIQETFTRVWFSAHTFDRLRGNFKGWVYTIALNIARNEMSKKEYTYHFLEADEGVQYDSNGNTSKNQSPAAIMEQEELRDSIVNALSKLDPSLREVVIMKNYQHLKFREIAEVMKIPESTLKSRYIKAISCLKNHLNPVEVM